MGPPRMDFLGVDCGKVPAEQLLSLPSCTPCAVRGRPWPVLGSSSACRPASPVGSSTSGVVVECPPGWGPGVCLVPVRRTKTRGHNSP